MSEAPSRKVGVHFALETATVCRLPKNIFPFDQLTLVIDDVTCVDCLVHMGLVDGHVVLHGLLNRIRRLSDAMRFPESGSGL